ncbi:MAG: tetratricopeptide repeat protein, partial [Anaerolineales bacterium]|nr:tetratricopeptide repeat protein [Anaerolineales bacterium]
IQISSMGNLNVNAQIGQADPLNSLHEALEISRSVGDKHGVANALQAIGDVQQFRDGRDAALESYAQALALFRSVGDRLGEANVLYRIGDVQQFRKDNDAALDSYAQALALFRSVGARLGEANVLAAQARLRIQSGQIAEAESMTLFRSFRFGAKSALFLPKAQTMEIFHSHC